MEREAGHPYLRPRHCTDVLWKWCQQKPWEVLMVLKGELCKKNWLTPRYELAICSTEQATFYQQRRVCNFCIVDLTMISVKNFVISGTQWIQFRQIMPNVVVVSCKYAITNKHAHLFCNCFSGKKKPRPENTSKIQPINTNSPSVSSVVAAAFQVLHTPPQCSPLTAALIDPASPPSTPQRNAPIFRYSELKHK